MCDYSLHGVKNRLAKEGETLFVHKFGSSSKGLASKTDFEAVMPRGLMRFLCWLFVVETKHPAQLPAVCVPPGARLRLTGILKVAQEKYGVRETEEVTFTQITSEPFRYRDAFRFGSGCEVLIQNFSEGVDLPSANCALFARPTKSQIVYSQAIGRITRLSPETGKTDGLVLDMVGVTNKFDLVTLGDLVGVRSLKDGETISQAVEREKKEAEEAAAEQLDLPEIADGKVVGREVDLFGGRQIQKRGLFEWQINTDAKRSKLNVTGHTFEIWREGGSGWYGFADMHWKGTLNGRTMDYREAREKIEEEARRLLFGDKDAPWRSSPASEKQVNLLLKFKIPFDPHITKGQASDLLDARFKKARAAV